MNLSRFKAIDVYYLNQIIRYKDNSHSMNIDFQFDYSNIGCDSISRYTLQYIKDVFYTYDIDGVHNPLDHMYLITYRNTTSDPEIALKQFFQMNTQLIYNIAGKEDFYKYLPVQHAGVVFVDCHGSRHGYVRDMTGLHNHSVAIVHPDWKSKFLDGVTKFENSRISELNDDEWIDQLLNDYSGLHVAKIRPTNADVLKVISYCSKAIMYSGGFYHGREGLFEFIGPRRKPKEGLVPVRVSKKMTHWVSPNSLTKH